MASSQPSTTNSADQAAFDAMTAIIRKTIDDQNNMFNAIQAASDASFSTNRKTYNITQGVSDVKTQRDEIWNFLQDKYNENTNLRKYLFEKELANKVELESHSKELDYLKKKVSEIDTTYDTTKRNIQNEMYNHSRYIYMFHLYKLLILIQFLIIIILAINLYGMLSSTITMIIIAVILFLSILYIIYYIYYNNYNRNSFEWDKFYYGEPVAPPDSNCSKTSVSAEEQDLQHLAANADAILSKYISSASCTAPTTTPSSTPSSTPTTAA
jgi:hypothetical protein